MGINSTLSFTAAVLILFLICSILRLFHALPLFFTYCLGVLTCLLVEAGLFWHYLTKTQEKAYSALATARQNTREINLFNNQGIPPACTDESIAAEMAEREPLISGALMIQIMDRKKQIHLFFSLFGSSLNYRPLSHSAINHTQYNAACTDGLESDGVELQVCGDISLEGAQVRLLKKKSKHMEFAIRVIHPDRRLLPNVDHFYLISKSLADCERWYFALLTCCTQEISQHYAEFSSRLNRRFSQFWHAQESANWLNILLSCIHINMCHSNTFKNKISNKVVRSLSRATERNLFDYITNFEVLDINLGTKVPNVENVIAIPPDRAGNFTTDFWIHYAGGDASISLSCDVCISRLATVPVKLTIHLHSLSGRLQMKLPPYHSEFISLSFFEEPSIHMSLDVVLRKKSLQLKNILITKLKEIIIARLKLAFSEKFVNPRCRCIKIGCLEKPNPAVPSKSKVLILSDQMQDPANLVPVHRDTTDFPIEQSSGEDGGPFYRDTDSIEQDAIENNNLNPIDPSISDQTPLLLKTYPHQPVPIGDQTSTGNSNTDSLTPPKEPPDNHLPQATKYQSRFRSKVKAMVFGLSG